MDLTTCTTAGLIAALRQRADLRQPNGWLADGLFELVNTLVPRICVDAFPMRMHYGTVELGLIKRGTGPFKGRWCAIGGLVNYGETVRAAIMRHWKTDLGIEVGFLENDEWQRPACVRQYGPWGDPQQMPEGFGPEPQKHAVVLTYLVTIPEDAEIAFRATEAGTETQNLHWFSRTSAPNTPDQFGYGHDSAFWACFQAAERICRTQGLISG